jgi:hypothetical protein
MFQIPALTKPQRNSDDSKQPALLGAYNQVSGALSPWILLFLFIVHQLSFCSNFFYLNSI